MEPGEYVDAEGRVMGRHQGYANYTIGQRKGLGIATGTPQFVTRVDAEHNRVVLGAHDDLYIYDVRAREGFFRGDASRPVMAQIRYRSQASAAQVYDFDDTSFALRFEAPVWAVTPGQSTVIYQDDLLVGGGGM